MAASFFTVIGSRSPQDDHNISSIVFGTMVEVRGPTLKKYGVDVNVPK